MLLAMSGRLPIPARAVLSAAITVAAFGACEMALRLVQPGWSGLYVGDPHSHWTLRTGLNEATVPHAEEGSTFSVKTNALGLRDGALPNEKPWVLALGCSTTFGWGVDAEAAWPEQLEQLLGVEVINAGVPGHSTHQGLKFAIPLLEQRPTAVIFGWGLRDGDAASVPDSKRVAPPWVERLRLTGELRKALPIRRKASPASVRVPPLEFESNLATLMGAAESSGAAVVLLDMTVTEEHSQALRNAGPVVVVPVFADGDRFEADSIHFTGQGNRAIAEQLAPIVRGVLSGKEPPSPAPPGPPQTP